MITDVFNRLRDADPAKHLPGYDDARLSAMAHAIAGGDGADLGVSPGGARRVLPRRLLLAVPVAAIAAAALVIAPALTHAPSASAEAATALNRAADHITASDPSAEPGQWWKVVTTGFRLAMIDTSPNDPAARLQFLQAYTDTDYVSVGGSQPTVSVSGPTTFVRQLAGDPVVAADLDGWLHADSQASTSDLAPQDTPGSWQSPNPAFLAELPRETSELRQRLYDDSAAGGSSADAEAFDTVVDILRSGRVPADLRSVLYRVLATVPGVEITSRSATVGTDTGIAFGRDESSDGSRKEIVIDPGNGNLLGERHVATAVMDGIPAGTVTSQTTVTRTLVDTVPADVLDNAKVWDCDVVADGTTVCRG